MCGGTAGDIIKGAQKEADKAIKGVQKAADSAVNQTKAAISMPDLTKIGRINLSGSGGGKGSPIGSGLSSAAKKIDFSNIPTPNLDQDLAAPVVKAAEEVATPVVEKVVAPAVKAVEEVAKPVEQVAQTAVQAATPVVEAAVETVKAPVKAVEQITKIDAPKVVESVAKETILAPVKAAQTVTKAAEPVTQAAAQVVQQPVKAVQEITKIDVPKVAETVVKQAAQVPIKTVENVAQVALTAAKPVFDLGKIDYARDFNELTSNANDLLGQTLLEAGKAVEPVLGALSTLNPFGGTGGGSGGSGGAQYDAQQADLGDDQVFGDLEKATGKDSKLTEEERLRRIRRLLLNRYGRENTILTTGPGDTKSRRRYAL
jgi:hypothetical protein